MLPSKQEKQVHTIPPIPDNISEWANAFYTAKKVEGLSAHTLAFYRQQLSHFLKYSTYQIIENISQLTPATIRGYLLWLEESGHNPGGVHAAYRTLKVFLRWYELEAEPAGWHNPITKVKAPKTSLEPLEPVSLSDVDRMTRTCKPGFYGARDKALMLFLLDTGARAREICAVDLADVDQVTGAVTIRKGKGGESRTVFLERKARRAFRAYLKTRTDHNPAAFVNDEGERLGYSGLRALLVRRAAAAGVPSPTPHDFRRAFALTMLRNGCDLITLARLMGHKSLEVLRRYLKQVTEDLQAAHSKGSPVEHMKGGDT